MGGHCGGGGDLTLLSFSGRIWLFPTIFLTPCHADADEDAEADSGYHNHNFKYETRGGGGEQEVSLY